MTTNPDVLRLAREIVAANTDSWGWGPLADFEGLSEHDLAVNAAIAAIERTKDLSVQFLRTDDGLETIAAFERYAHLRQPEKGSTDE